jgi:hypothetical protein
MGQFRNKLESFEASGDYFALIVETYGVVYRYTPFPLAPEFLDFLYKSMVASKLQYHSIASLRKIAQNMPLLEFHQ